MTPFQKIELQLNDLTWDANEHVCTAISTAEPFPFAPRTKKRILCHGALPGESVHAQVIGYRERHPVAIALTPSNISQHRVTPACPHFLECGGCRWQHAAIEQQLAWKESWVKELIYSANPTLPQDLFQKIIPVIEQYHYRNKMEFSFDRTPEGQMAVGLIGLERKLAVVDLTTCKLAPDWFDQALELTRKWWHRHPDLAHYSSRRQEGLLKNLTLRSGLKGKSKMAILTLNQREASLPQSTEPLDEWLQEMIQTFPEISLHFALHHAEPGTPTKTTYHNKSGLPHLVEELSTQERILSFWIAPSAFFQPNPIQASLIYQKALDAIPSLRDAIVYDLYCGTGTLSLFAAVSAKMVYGIELNADAVAIAQSNQDLNHLTNTHFVAGDVSAVLAQWRQNSSMEGSPPPPDAVIVDPPRSGLTPKAIQELLHLAPPVIVYISCNPATQAANLIPLLAAGYEVLSIQPIDQFPHTPHVENIVVLQKRVLTDSNLAL